MKNGHGESGSLLSSVFSEVFGSSLNLYSSCLAELGLYRRGVFGDIQHYYLLL
jgi:hypothetical protein